MTRILMFSWHFYLYKIVGHKEISEQNIDI